MEINTSIESELMSIMSKNAQRQFDDGILDTKHRIDDSATRSTAVNDSYGNSLTAIGNNDKVKTFTNYGFSNDSLNWTLWLALYNDSWVFRRAIDKPAQDMVRSGITFQTQTDMSEIQRQFVHYRFDFIQLVQWGALFGGSVAVMLFDNMNDVDYAKPMDFNRLKHYKALRLYVTDRWYGCAPETDEVVTDMTSIDFGKPKFYNITLADGKTIKFHHDFVLRYEHRTAPKLVKNGMLQGWGYAEGAHILNELARDDDMKSSIQSLVNKALIEVIKMSGMRGVFMGADSDNEQQLRKRLEMVNWGRSYNSLTFLDKDDEYEQNTFGGLSGLSDLLEKNMWLISAALEMQGVLFGDLKQGFSNDVDALERYDETINGRCESYLRPIYEKFIAVLFKLNNIEEKVEFRFNSLLMKKQDEDRINGLKNFVDLLSTVLSDGAIDTQQYAKALQNYASNGIVDFGLTDEVIAGLKDKMKEEMEDIEV